MTTSSCPGRLALPLRRAGSAFLMVIGVLGLLSLIVFSLSRLNVSRRWAVYFSSYETRAEGLAEMALDVLADKIIKPEMNDHKVLFQALARPMRFFDNWYTKFRVPTVMANATVDPMNAATPLGDINNGTDMELNVDPLNNTIIRGIAYKPLTYTRTWSGPNSPAPADLAARPLILLDDTLQGMGGSITVRVSGRIKSAFGILPKADHEYHVGGVTIDTSPVSGWIGSLLHRFELPNIKLQFNIGQHLALLLPDTPIFELNLKAMIAGLKYRVNPQPAPVGPPGTKKLAISTSTASRYTQKLSMFRYGNTMSREPHISGIR